jgi:hydrophobe/amphiphile efflux-3 (HAE3) family protein
MRENYNSNSFFGKLAAFILAWRWPLVVAVLLLTAFFFYEMRSLKMDNSNEAFFVEEDETRITYNKFKDIFGNDEFVYILFETEGFFQPETIKLIGRLATDLEEHVPYVKDMTFLGNVEYVEGVEDGIEIYDLMEDFPETPKQMEIIKKKAMAERLYLDNLISPDGKTAAILLELDPYPGDKVDARRTIAPVVREILDRPQYASLEHYTVGIPIINYDIQAVTARETPLFMLICIVLEMLILFWTIRRVRGVIAPIIVVILSVFWTLGMVGIMGWTLNMMVIIIPTLLIAVGIGDSMHVVAEFQDQQQRGLGRKEAITNTLTIVGLPCLLTTLTTAAAFLSFLATAIKPIREMGAYAAIGVITALVLSLIVVPVFFSFGKDRKKAVSQNPTYNRNDLFDRILGWIALINIKHPRAILGIFFVLIVLSVGGYFLIEVESNTIKMFSKRLPVRQAFDYVDSHMGGSMSVEIMADTGKKDGVKDPAFLQQLESLQDYINKHPMTMKTMSVLDLLKKMNQALHENHPEYYTLPETKEQVSEYMFLYETAGGGELDKQVSFNYDIARLTARTKSLDTKDIKIFISDVTGFAKEHLDPSIKIEYTGMIPMVNAMSDLITSGQIKSFGCAFIAISLMMIMVLRSFKLGLISMIPNLFPVLIAIGFMGYAGIYLSMALVTFGAIIIGIAVDDTIHFFVRYRREFNRTGTYEGALKDTLLTVGRPIIFTTITLVAGFSVFALSDISNIGDFGLMAGFAIIWALLADFFLAPAMMLLFKPLGPERKITTDN